MKQFFEMGEYVPAPIPGKRLIPGIGYVPDTPPLPELTDALITTADRFDDGMTRVWALAARLDFEGAEAQLLAIVEAPDRGGPLEREAAERLCGYALQHAHDDDLTVHAWLRERGISLWYAFGAQATSGGEGAERATYIRAAERRFQELDKKLNRASPSAPVHNDQAPDRVPPPMIAPSTTVTLAAATMLLSGLPRLKERKLADIGVISVPAAMDSPSKSAVAVAHKGRVWWMFADTYFWASFGSITRYKQQLAVAIMAPDATPTEYEEFYYELDPTYDSRKQVQRLTIGTGQLTVYECVYALGADREQAYQYLYVDRSRRLQIAWHAVAKEVDLKSAIALVPRIADSFRLVRDPVALFVDMREAPRKEAAARVDRLSTVQAMLRREGLPTLVPGKPVMHRGAFVEWMSDPEPRYQVLVPLGKMRASTAGTSIPHPRPVRGKEYDDLPGTVGWREAVNGDWTFTNNDNAYLPLPGIGTALAATSQDRGYFYFYYVATIRVEEEDDDRLLTSLDWFFKSVPEVQRRWREGLLVGPGKPETGGDDS
jgi:hypothetical protein